MRRENLNDTEVELEIERLRGTDEVHLAQKEIRLKNRRRIYMAQLRVLEKRGRELMEQGITFENIEEKLFPELVEDEK